ncbi:MAG: Ig-like domain-containing protein [Reichenbachiella sp.]|uniref:Ig-like domain-containing protein n=3 Tax=Reichenbachiella sp. TaxID=2184521 RepID=UPI003262E8D1
MKKLNSTLMSALIIFSLLTSCTEDEPQIKITSFSFNTASVEVVEGTSVNLNDHLTIEGEDAGKAEVVFSSSNEEIVTVDGLTLSAIGVGEAVITATETNTDQSATIEVTVIAANVAVTGVSLDQESIELVIGGTQQLTATIAPENASEKGLIWSVEFPSTGKKNEDDPTLIATVSEEGLVTAISPGEVNVVVKTKDGDFTASTNVVVSGIPVTGVTLDSETADLKVGGTLQLVATIVPESATEKGLSWSVDFPSESKIGEVAPTDIATVSETGLVTAISAGNIVVTATTTDGNHTASVHITITNVAVTSITLDQSNVSVNIGETIQMSATIAPENATNKNITWAMGLVPVDPFGQARTEISAPVATNYATIDENGLITGVSECTSCGLIVTATSEDGSIEAFTSVKVLYVPVTSITLAPSSFTVNAGETQQMTPTILPVNASNKNISWTIETSSANCRTAISAPTYATVDENGLVTGQIDPGCYDLTVVATSADGPTGSTDFDVVQLVTGLTINTAAGGPVTGDLQLNYCLSGTYQLGITVSPGNASNDTVSWSVEDDSVVTIDGTGKLTYNTALPDGTYTTQIMAAANDGSGIATTITVVLTKDCAG